MIDGMHGQSSINVLFVCMGNICRSPTGEGVFRHYVEKAGYAIEIHIESAGTIGYHSGSPADARMQIAASQRGYQLTSLARAVTTKDTANFDLIVAMDSDNLADLERIAGGWQNHMQLLGAFLDGVEDASHAPSVPDPYYGGDAGFAQVLDMIEQACPALLAHCLKLLKPANRVI